MMNKTVSLAVIAAAMLSSVGCTQFYDQYGEKGQVRLRTWVEMPLATTPLAVGFDSYLEWHALDGDDSDVTLALDQAGHAVLGEDDIGSRIRPLVAGDLTLRFFRAGNEIDRFVMHAVDVPALDLGGANLKPRVFENAFYEIPIATPAGNDLYFTYVRLSMLPRLVDLVPDGRYALVTKSGSLVYDAGSASQTIAIEAVKPEAIVEFSLTVDSPVFDNKSTKMWHFPIRVTASDAVGPVEGASCTWPIQLNNGNAFAPAVMAGQIDAVLVAPRDTVTATCVIGSLQKTITLIGPP